MFRLDYPKFHGVRDILNQRTADPRAFTISTHETPESRT
jgi:hypothetical protein